MLALSGALVGCAGSSAVNNGADGTGGNAHGGMGSSPTNTQPVDGGNDAGARLSIVGKDWAELLDQGVWLVGWAAAGQHYLWFRFTPDASGTSQGTFELREVEDCVRCMPYVDCTGAGGRYSVNGSELLTTYPPACELDGQRWLFGE